MALYGSPHLLINKSGVSVPVYDALGTTVIGELVNREAYIAVGNEGSAYGIQFLKPDGSFGGGIINNTPDGALADCIDYPYGTETINGREYKTFIMRSMQSVYTATGTYWGKVAANCKVACLDNIAGQNNNWLKLVYYIQSSSGEWVPVTGDGVEYGFVDTGIRSASSYAKIAFYGSW